MELFKLFGTLGLNGVNDTENQLDSVTNKAETSSGKIGSAFKKIGAAVAAAFALDKIKQFGVAAVQAGAEVAAEEAAFTQIMGDYSDQAAAKVQKIADATGIVNTRLTPYMTSLSAKFKGLGYVIDDASDMASTGLNIAADAAAFWDKSLEDAMGSLNSFINGSYEGGESIGLFANETALATWSAEKLGLKWADLSEKEKQFVRLQFAKAMQEASGAAGQAAKEADAYQNVMGNLTEACRQFKAQVGEPILENIVIPGMKLLGDFITNTLIPKFKVLKDWVSENGETIKKWAGVVATATGVVAGFVGAVKGAQVIQKLVTAFQAAQVQLALYTMETRGASIAQGLLNGELTLGQVFVGLLTGKISLAELATKLWAKAQTKLNIALAANPIGLVIAAIAALVAILVVAYKKNEDFREAVQQLFGKLKELAKVIWDSLKPVFEELIGVLQALWELAKATVIPLFEEVMDAVMELWETIKPIIELLWPIVQALLQNIFGAVLTKLQSVLIVVKTVLTAIKNVINLITALIKGDWSGAWEAIKNIFSGVWDGISGIASNAINGIKSMFSNMFDGIKKVVEKLKGLFNFKWSLPALKIPKFSISPSGWKVGDLLKGSIPRLAVKWAAKGGVFDKPTIGAVGIGEAGAEAVVPLDQNKKWISKVAQDMQDAQNKYSAFDGERIYTRLDAVVALLEKLTGMKIYLDSGTLVGELAPAVDASLGEISRLRARGN